MPNRPRAGELLVARAGAMDDDWHQAVVLLLDSDESGALGVVLNRLSSTSLEEVLPQWQELVCPPQELFEGGPVSPGGAVCVAKPADPREDPPGWRRVHQDLGLLHLDTPVELVRGAYADLRIFAGYCGWAPGQLETELVRGDWHRVPVRDEDVFGVRPHDLWRRVLRRQGGELATFSTWTEDPALN
ncbi:YqgE/AlgH family protein [Luteococcus sp. Sow4_B9]|uniref:YqgE/AlgH family protein n=1 Tax=Luteococcus sp. Sow4_B9 TaxID=3438792 RepID=UPI003F9A4F14